VEVLDLEEGGGSRPAEQMEERARRAAVVATFGSRALRAAGKWTARPALVASMVLAADAGEAGEGRGMTVLLDVRLPQVLDELKRLAPRRTRLGLIRLKQPGSVPAQELAGAARERGYTLMVADVAGAEQLLDAFHGMVGKVDLVWCPPDADLFNSATIKPLILASLEHRIPLVGFSPSFLRAGATLGVWPDYGAVGQQTAEACARALEGRTGGKEYPKKVRSGVNERLARLLGADDIQTKDAGDVVIVR
jgi:hypothetical protein